MHGPVNAFLRQVNTEPQCLDETRDALMRMGSASHG